LENYVKSYTRRRRKWFFALFGGIEMVCSSMCRQVTIGNPEGIESHSPGLARFWEGLPWVSAFEFDNPERVEYQ